MAKPINKNALNVDRDAKAENNGRYAERISAILPIVPHSKVLEVGCGGGELLRILHDRFQADCHGVEPFPLYETAISPDRITRTKAEALPFPDDHFDLVIMKDVIEHVEDVECSLAEAVRVSRKYLYIMSPNYLFPYEAHFKRPFIPMLPKPLARLYFQALGFDKAAASFIDHIQYVHQSKMRRALGTSNQAGRIQAIVDLQAAKRYRFSGFNPRRWMEPFINSKFELLVIKDSAS